MYKRQVGINATRALTCKYNAQLACGRVQTPTLAMIAAREEEIKDFVPRNYYGIETVSYTHLRVYPVNIESSFLDVPSTKTSTILFKKR